MQKPRKVDLIKEQIDHQVALELVAQELEERALKLEKKLKEEVVPLKPMEKTPDVIKQEQEKQTHLELAYARAEQLYLLKNTQLKRKLFGAWSCLQMLDKRRIEKISLFRHWHQVQAVWSVWKSKTRNKVHRRHILLEAELFKSEQANLAKATRLERISKLSKAWIAWKKFIYNEKQERKLKEQHEERSKRMLAFLNQLEEKHNRGISDPNQHDEQSSLTHHERDSSNMTIELETRDVSRLEKKPKSLSRSDSKPKKEPIVFKECKLLKSMQDREQKRLEKKRQRLEQKKLKEQQLEVKELI